MSLAIQGAGIWTGDGDAPGQAAYRAACPGESGLGVVGHGHVMAQETGVSGLGMWMGLWAGCGRP